MARPPILPPCFTMQTAKQTLFVTAAALVLVGCGEARPLASDPRTVVTWQGAIAPLVADHCSACHSGAQPAGNYRTTDYTSLLGPGTDSVPNAIAGDENSRLLGIFQTADPSDPHAGLQDDLPLLRSWVVASSLAYSTSSIHSGGIMDPSQPDFHGKLIRAAGLDMSTCQRCHGGDLSGGQAGVSCLSCHDGTPSSCATCHAALTNSEPHRTHVLGGGLGKAYACGTCHDQPVKSGLFGHISQAGVATPVSVVFSGLPASGVDGGAVWNPQSLTCTNVYCHAPAGKDTAAQTPAPVWSTETKIKCGSCHGLPPVDGLHPAVSTIQDCSRCHPSTIDRAGQLIGGSSVDGGIGGSNHLNGVVNVP